MGDKWNTSVNSYGRRHPEWETSVGDMCGRQVGHKCKLMPPKAPREGDKCRRQACKTSSEDKCKLMRLKEPRVGDKSERQLERPPMEVGI